MRLNIDELGKWLEQHLPDHLHKIGLGQDRVAANYVLNWGGFVNHSFTISAGSKRYHLKVTDEKKQIPRLEAWRDLHEILETRYKAPRLIHWVDFSEIGFSGLLFEHIVGVTADLNRNRELVPQLVDIAALLHEDSTLRRLLDGREAVSTRLDHFTRTYIERFTSDLEVVGADRPPFVTSVLLQWMKDETCRLLDVAGSKKVFRDAAVEPVHGDLHEGNIIVSDTGLNIVDWDDLQLGDAAVEFAVLLWPLVREGGTWQAFARLPGSRDFAERMQICLRAQLLDEVIDNLADYVEASVVVPEQQTMVRAVKQSRHEEALRKYRDGGLL